MTPPVGEVGGKALQGSATDHSAGFEVLQEGVMVHSVKRCGEVKENQDAERARV